MSTASGNRPAPDAAPPASGGTWRRTLIALSVRDYAWYFTGNMAFFMAMQMNITLRGFLAYQLTDAATALGLVAVTFALPMLVAAPIGGVIADRVNKRTLVMVLQTLVAMVTLGITILIFTDLVEFWHLLVTSFLTSLVQSSIMPARQAMVPQLVPQQMMMNAVSLQMGAMNLTRIIGPALAGILIAPFGIGTSYAVTVALFLLGVLTLVPLPKHGMVGSQERKSFTEDLVGGFRFVANEPLFRLLIAAALIMPLFAFPLQHLLPVFATDVFERPDWGLGILMAATGAGGLLGALISANADHIEHKGRLMLAGGLVMGAGYIAFALTGNFYVALGMLAFGNIGRMLYQVTNQSVIQAKVPDEYRGRVMSLMMMSFGMMPLGVMPVSLAVDAIGPAAAITIHALIGIAVVCGIVIFSPRMRNLRLGALAEVELSPSEAARLVAQGKLTQEEADHRTGRATLREEYERAGPTSNGATPDRASQETPRANA